MVKNIIAYFGINSFYSLPLLAGLQIPECMPYSLIFYTLYFVEFLKQYLKSFLCIQDGSKFYYQGHWPLQFNC